MSKTVIILIALGSVVAYVGVWLWIFTEQKRAIDEQRQRDWQACNARQEARQNRYAALIDKVRQNLARREALLHHRKASRRPQPRQTRSGR